MSLPGPHRGSCLCGLIRYELDGELGPVTWCHCSRCRKGNGTAFLVASPVDASKFRIVAGADLVTEFESSPGVFRTFCRNCGSPLYGRRDSLPGILRLRPGTLDTPWDGRPAQHIFTAYKADWFDIHDEAPQFDERG
jgi:hypothetical protein